MTNSRTADWIKVITDGSMPLGRRSRTLGTGTRVTLAPSLTIARAIWMSKPRTERRTMVTASAHGGMTPKQRVPSCEVCQ